MGSPPHIFLGWTDVNDVNANAWKERLLTAAYIRDSHKI